MFFLLLQSSSCESVFIMNYRLSEEKTVRVPRTRITVSLFFFFVKKPRRARVCGRGYGINRHFPGRIAPGNAYPRAGPQPSQTKAQALRVLSAACRKHILPARTGGRPPGRPLFLSLARGRVLPAENEIVDIYPMKTPPCAAVFSICAQGGSHDFICPLPGCSQSPDRRRSWRR